jgi:hypothetical protein
LNKLIINIGPLTSFGSLQYYLAPKLAELRSAYVKGESPEVVWDFRNVNSKSSKIAPMTAFLALAKKVSDFTGKPTRVILNWDPNLLGLWKDIGLFEISKRFEIFEWPEEMIGGSNLGRTNESTKILYFADLRSAQDFSTMDELVNFKIELKQKILPNLILRASSILNNLRNKDFVIKIANATVELIVNALVHSEDIAFVAFQVSGGGVTIAVCDSGIGFPKSLKKSYPELTQNKILTHQDAILLGCLIKQNSMGLRYVIDDILNMKTAEYEDIDKNYGWINISSYNAEFRWQRDIWQKAKQKISNYTDGDYDKLANEILGEPKIYLDSEDYKKGYWRIHKDRLIGTRISFEIKK